MRGVVHHSVLGSMYKVEFGKREDISISEENIGEHRHFAKKISICTEMDDCATRQELKARTREVLAHELLHAYLSEAGICLDAESEELLCDFFMRNCDKIHNSLEHIMDKLERIETENGFLDK